TEPQITPPVTPETTNNDLDDDLLLDDDLFGDTTDTEELLKDDNPLELDNNEEEDIFAGLDDDLDFNLEDENGEDPFAGIGDDGDLDLDDPLADVDLSSSDISVNGKDKALGLEEMERALDEVVIDDESDEEEFELSDDGLMSQDDLDALLNAGIDEQAAEQQPLDQSSLDDLLDDVGKSG
ncbi:hypothetical protein AKJ18_26050, partial [Vibrio xuii]